MPARKFAKGSIMKKIKRLQSFLFTGVFFALCLIFSGQTAYADDSCVFQSTADDLEANIVILLDNGAEMEHAAWHSSYDNDTDYTPGVGVEKDYVKTPAVTSGTLTLTNIITAIVGNAGDDIDTVPASWEAETVSFTSDCSDTPINCGSGYGTGTVEFDTLSGGTPAVGDVVIFKQPGTDPTATVTSVTMDVGPNGFFHDNGYAVIITGGIYYLVEVPTDLVPANHSYQLQATTSNTDSDYGVWTINGRAIRLPAEPSAAVDGNGIIDNATYFRYSKNYLNWLFFATGAGSYINESSVDDGTDLPVVTRFYYAKQALISVIKQTANKAKFGIYNFTSNAAGASNVKPLAFAVNTPLEPLPENNTLEPQYLNALNNMGTVTYSPLAEGLSTIGYYYSSPSSGASGGYCQQNFTVVVTPGVSSEDQGTTSSHVPATLSDYDGDNDAGGITEGKIKPTLTGTLVFSGVADGTFTDGEELRVTINGVPTTKAIANGTVMSGNQLQYRAMAIEFEAGDVITGASSSNTATVFSVTLESIPVGQNGSTYLDDIAYYLYNNDIVNPDNLPDTGALMYHTLTAAFSVNETITVGNNAGTALITAIDMAAGTLELSGISGTFDDNEIISGNGGGRASMNGTLFTAATGNQSVSTYTVGLMCDDISKRFLINTSNNGNGNTNLYDQSHEEYGKYHYSAESPDDLAAQLMAAVNAIVSRTSTFTAPVVPVTRTTSGDKIYLAFFKPLESSNFWEGNVTKFGISSTLGILDKDSNVATYANGAIIEDAVPYWATQDWADEDQDNYIHNSDRNIYTYLGDEDLDDPSNAFNENMITAAMLGEPATYTAAQIIAYVRGADMLDEDLDTDKSENRAVITGDVLHSEPTVFIHRSSLGGTVSSQTMVYFGSNDGMLHAVLDEVDSNVDTAGNETLYGTEHWAFIPPDLLASLKNMVEGAGHQIYVDSTPKIYFYDADSDGIVDPGDRVILICGERKGGSSYFAIDITDPDAPEFLWRIGPNTGTTGGLELTLTSGTFNQDGEDLNVGGTKKAEADGTLLAILPFDNKTVDFNVGDVITGGTSTKSGTVGGVLTGSPTTTGALFLGNVTGAFQDNEDLKIGGAFGTTKATMADEVYGGFQGFLRFHSKMGNFAVGNTVSGGTSGGTATVTGVYVADPNLVIPELGQSWSEPQFGKVKTTLIPNGVDVFFIGGGYSSTNASGKAVLAINVLTGAVVKKFTADAGANAMAYSFPSNVYLIKDADDFVEKIYVGDLGGQMWRFGNFTGTYPASDLNIDNWEGRIFFKTDADNSFKFMYPPSVTDEIGYQLVLMGTGDRENACEATTSDRIYAVKDDHSNTTIVGEVLSGGAVIPDDLVADDLVDVTDTTATPPVIDDADGDVDSNSNIDKGWYIRLQNGEKVLSEGTVLSGVLYTTSFVPNDQPCVPGGDAMVYALNYKTGAAVLSFTDGSDDLLVRSVELGGGIPSRPVPFITDQGVQLLISVGSTKPDPLSPVTGAGITMPDTVPEQNFFYLYWKELFD